MAKAKKKTSTKKTTSKTSAKKKSAPAKKKAGSKRKPNAGFMKAMKPSVHLAEIVGAVDLARTEAVKQIWKYIKKHKLQDPKNMRNIIADDLLKPIFGGKAVVSMFEMTKHLSKHLK
jgi:upstream activation factor subunit UAF30